MRLWLILFASVAVIAGNIRAEQQFPPPQPGDRIVIVAPHPDDEVLGAGGLIQQAIAVGADVRIIYLTNGDHNQIAFKLYRHSLFLRPRNYLAFGKQRRLEAIAATGLLGVTPDRLTFLGYPDYGTLRIWRDCWEDGDVFTSDATRTNAVPYADAFQPGHLYTPQNVVADLTALFRQFKPTRIFVTHPADTNPDHRAAANFVRLAALQLEGEGQHPRLEYYVIHFGLWPRPPHYHPEMEMAPPPALLDNGDWMTLPLLPEQAEKKYAAILKNQTQTTTRQYFLVSFARSNELFATVAVPQVPYLPNDQPPDWRKAVRAKSIPVRYGSGTQRMNDHPLASPAPEIVPLEHVDFLRQGGDLIAQVELKNRFGKRTGVHLFLFGYRHGTDFAALPKVEINITPLGGLNVYVGGKRLLRPGVTFNSVANRFFVRVPLSLLGGVDLDHLFTAAWARLGEIAVDDTAWQLFELEPPPKG